MENQRFISELTTKTSICSVTCSVFPWFSHVFPWYSHYPCLMGPHDAWGGLPLSGEAIMRKYDEIRVVFLMGLSIMSIVYIWVRTPDPWPPPHGMVPQAHAPPMVWSPKLTLSGTPDTGPYIHACMHNVKYAVQRLLPAVFEAGAATFGCLPWLRAPAH